MSPEQTRGEPVDARTDLWSLGVVLYKMLTGRQPFRGHDLAVINDIRHAEPLRVEELREDVPPALARTVDLLRQAIREGRNSWDASTPNQPLKACATIRRSRN